jgi:hypothetical protein
MGMYATFCLIFVDNGRLLEASMIADFKPEKEVI